MQWQCDNVHTSDTTQFTSQETYVQLIFSVQVTHIKVKQLIQLMTKFLQFPCKVDYDNDK